MQDEHRGCGSPGLAAEVVRDDTAIGGAQMDVPCPRHEGRGLTKPLPLAPRHAIGVGRTAEQLEGETTRRSRRDLFGEGECATKQQVTESGHRYDLSK